MRTCESRRSLRGAEETQSLGSIPRHLPGCHPSNSSSCRSTTGGTGRLRPAGQAAGRIEVTSVLKAVQARIRADLSSRLKLRHRAPASLRIRRFAHPDCWNGARGAGSRGAPGWPTAAVRDRRRPSPRRHAALTGGYLGRVAQRGQSTGRFPAPGRLAAPTTGACAPRRPRAATASVRHGPAKADRPHLQSYHALAPVVSRLDEPSPHGRASHGACTAVSNRRGKPRHRGVLGDCAQAGIGNPNVRRQRRPAFAAS